MHRIILSLAIILVLTGVVLGYFFAIEKRLPSSMSDLATSIFHSAVVIPENFDIKNEISSQIPQMDDLKNTDAGSQFKILGERAGEITQHSQNVLGKSIQKNEKEATPLHESALEYGKYIYCKQVVDLYEEEANQATDTSDSEQDVTAE